MKNTPKTYWLKLKEFFPWVLAAFTVLAANLASSAFWETFEIWADGDTGVISKSRIGYVLFFFLMVWVLYLRRDAFFRPRTRYLANEVPEPRKHLILFLSDLDTSKGGFHNGIPEGLNLSNDLEKDIKAIELHKKTHPFWRWEMPLRGIRTHLGILETVTLVCSRQSIQQKQWFLDICKRYEQLDNVTFYLLVKGKPHLIPASSQVLDPAQGFVFESFDELSDAMWILLKKFKKRKFLERDIMIDFTGGQKVTSVVAAAITFNREVKAQYVQTNHPWETLSYDVIHASSDTGGLGT